MEREDFEKYEAEKVYRLFLNDPGRVSFINEITRLCQIAPLKRVIVEAGVTKFEIDDSFQEQIDFIKEKLLEYEESLKSRLSESFPTGYRQLTFPPPANQSKKPNQ